MKRCRIIFGMMLGLGLAAESGAYGMLFTGDNVGVVSAVVMTADTEKGLAVRIAPSPQARVQAYVPVGAKIRGYASFQNGYVKIESPSRGGWVRLDHLQPVGGLGTVASVDRPELCLRIRSGPASSFDVVGCAAQGQVLQLTGLWGRQNWAQIAEPVPGWVSASQITSDIKPPPLILWRTKGSTPRRLRFLDTNQAPWEQAAGGRPFFPYNAVRMQRAQEPKRNNTRSVK